MFSHLRRKKERKTSMLNEVSLGELLMKWIFEWNSENMFLWSGKKNEFKSSEDKWFRQFGTHGICLVAQDLFKLKVSTNRFFFLEN